MINGEKYRVKIMPTEEELEYGRKRGVSNEN